METLEKQEDKDKLFVSNMLCWYSKCVSCQSAFCVLLALSCTRRMFFCLKQRFYLFFFNATFVINLRGLRLSNHYNDTKWSAFTLALGFEQSQ